MLQVDEKVEQIFLQKLLLLFFGGFIPHHEIILRVSEHALHNSRDVKELLNDGRLLRVLLNWRWRRRIVESLMLYGLFNRRQHARFFDWDVDGLVTNHGKHVFRVLLG